MRLITGASRKTLSAVLAVLVLTVPATGAYAVAGLGDIVHDPISYVQAVKQVQAWQEQYNQMTQSLEKAEATFQQMKSQVDAVTGVRGFGDILNNPLLNAVVPNDLAATLTDLNASGTLAGDARDLRAASELYDCGDLTADDARVICRAVLSQNAQARAVHQDTLALLNQRTVQIDALRAEISSTEDPKAIAELQARLQAEQAQVANDQNKIAVANAMLMANAQAAAQAEHERVNALMATGKTSVLDGFSFAALGYQSSPQAAEAEE